ncbi:MAG: bifunctional histidinol-phosphatase/imidazoleglycerol-phosphate dehydratase HisB [Mucilaginibacter polytrichastri]|nr:bifunctional histidinol-phosphatase/imidazoleglycerol-phosphate dehydratase HisB [Mucilaginibacter polytrichastri]
MSKRILFIDRDGTLILEPADEQIDSFAKLEFFPGVFTWLGRIARELDYELVMVTNQDGLGTDAHPEENFRPVHDFVLRALENEGIRFSEIIIDNTFARENKPTRKPGTDLLKHFFEADRCDLKNSYVIGDRLNDVLLARNLGAKAIKLTSENEFGRQEFDAQQIEELGQNGELIVLETGDWKQVYEFLKLGRRSVQHVRKTNETDIRISLNLDGTGKAQVKTGLPFFDHMLDQIARHGSIDLDIDARGDLHIDEHHTIEDTGIALGEAVAMALADKRGIERYGFCLPMDDCLAQVAIDFGGRNWIVWDAGFKREKIGDMPTEMFFHFFKSFSDAAKANLNIKAEGENEHHKIEAIFKAFAKAIKMAVKRDAEKMVLPSTKGML